MQIGRIIEVGHRPFPREVRIEHAGQVAYTALADWEEVLTRLLTSHGPWRSGESRVQLLIPAPPPPPALVAITDVIRGWGDPPRVGQGTPDRVRTGGPPACGSGDPLGTQARRDRVAVE
jgi:hypothetical protein